jgi:transcriptional regulator with XRE-family HTH domain
VGSTDTAEKFSQARADAGLSREQVAAGLGVSLSTVIRLEQGKARLTVELLRYYAELVDKPVLFFFEGVTT